MMYLLQDEIPLPEGEYKNRKDFQFFLFLHTANAHFAKKYLFHSSFTFLRRKLLSASQNALVSASDGFLAEENCREESSFSRQKIFFFRSRDFFCEIKEVYEIYIRMKKYRLFPPEEPVMQRARSFHIRSMEDFRSWISIERYDSDLLADETAESMRSEMVFYPSSAELAANELLRLAKLSSFLCRRMERREKTSFI